MHPILLFLTAIVCCCVAVRQQSVGVVGRLMCGDKPAAGVKVKLWDEDDGSERETTNIDPVFKVYHDCDDGFKPGQRKVKFRIPDKYISSGGLPKRMFNIGVLNLETIFAKEERDLI
ncbi:Transthyretin-like family protein [Necator americanus]|uniref:Transthyretin-like family protein n=1 Tax=Necator americanus TaxID=51031 RepID=W2SH51_NECAM|nr:Transthyretin-like family protein [Necator americanus]ETN68863.1 Transthyretin-like family protein [Necator americanus]